MNGKRDRDGELNRCCNLDLRQAGRNAGSNADVPSPELLASWPESRGPIWTDGLPVDWQGNVTATGGHVVVIAGIKQVPSSDLYQIYAYDPWPPNVGHAGWRPISHFVGILGAGSNPNRDVTFLQY